MRLCGRKEELHNRGTEDPAPFWFRKTHEYKPTNTNYEIEKAAKDLADVTDEIAKAQTALDVVNNREQMDIDI